MRIPRRPDKSYNFPLVCLSQFYFLTPFCRVGEPLPFRHAISYLPSSRHFDLPPGGRIRPPMYWRHRIWNLAAVMVCMIFLSRGWLQITEIYSIAGSPPPATTHYYLQPRHHRHTTTTNLFRERDTLRSLPRYHYHTK